MLPKHQIYALCDYELLQKFHITLSQYIQIISKYDVVYIQYRDKVNPLEVQKQKIQELQRTTNIPIIINDKLELLEFASGLHMGQEDLEDYSIKFRLSKQETIEHIKGKYPNKIIGLSTHNKIEIVEANSFDLDYIGLGAYRVTTTKDVKNSLGDAIINLAKCSKHPVGAIGGVRLDDKIPYVLYLVIGRDLLKNG